MANLVPKRPYSEYPPLVERAKSGDERAFAELLAPLELAGYRLAKRVLANPDDAQDALQLARVKAWRLLPSLRDAVTFPRWFRQIVWNEARYVSGYRARNSGRCTIWNEEFEIADSCMEPDERAYQAETIREVRKVLLALPGSYQVILDALMRDETQAETSARLGVPVTIVKKRKYVARKKFAAAWQSEIGGRP